MWVPILEIKKQRKMEEEAQANSNQIFENLRNQNWRFFRNHPTLVYKIGCQVGIKSGE